MANLTTWRPFRRAERGVTRQHDGGGAPRRLEDVLEEMFRDPFAMLRRPDAFFGDFSATRFSPTVDVSEDETHFKVTAELPGLDPSDVVLELEEGALVLRGEKRLERETKEEGWYHTERSEGRFSRVIPLPAEVDAEKAEASFKNGVLTVRIPKTAPKAKARQIPVQTTA